MELQPHSHGSRNAHRQWFLKVKCKSGAWKILMKGKQDNSPTQLQVPVAVHQQLSLPQERYLHLHELKDLSNEHASEAILLMQIIDVKAAVKENSMETPL